MTESQKNALQDIGIDVESALERFMGNEAMLEKYLKRFTENPTYNELLDAVANGNCKVAFEATHSLKGNTGTLSIMPLYELFSKQTEFFRNNDFAQGNNMMNEIDIEYKKIIATIKKVLE